MNDALLAMASFLPQDWPAVNVMIVFGAMLAFGTLGGLLAARVRWLPTITGFMALGLLVGPQGLGMLSKSALTGAQVLVDIALGLILFKLGTMLHPWKVIQNRALVLTSLVESSITFAAILGLMLWLDAVPLVAVLAAAIAVSSSPAVLIHVSQELKAKGPTVDTAEVLVALNNIWAFVMFSLALPIALHDARVDIAVAMLLPAYQLLGAMIAGIVVAWVVTRIARMTRHDEEHFRFALVMGAVMLTLGAAVALKVSGLFAAMTLGVACRWMEGRSRLTKVEFGDGADLFFIILFVFAGASLHLNDLVQYAPVAIAFVVARILAKCLSTYACGKVFGYSNRQSIAVGLLLVPMAGLAIGLAQTTSTLLPELGAQVSALVLAAVAVFETIGPPLTAFALRFVGEAGMAVEGAREDDDAEAGAEVAKSASVDNNDNAVAADAPGAPGVVAPTATPQDA